MLIAGAAVTGLGGESLQVVNEEALREWGSRCERELYLLRLDSQWRDLLP